MSTEIKSTFVAVDPRTGRQLRAATEAETAAYLAQPARSAVFRRAMRVGAVLIDESFGHGMRFDGPLWG